MDAAALIVMDKVSHHYQTKQTDLTILKSCSLTVQAGQSVAISGRSGAGKTTLLHILAGLCIPQKGQVTLLGHHTTTTAPSQLIQLRQLSLGFIFQDFKLIQCLSALDNVALPGQLAGHKDANERAMEALNTVDLSHRLHHYPHQLSGGEQQRVAIARAIAQRPKLLFADEPTGNLDDDNAEQILCHLFDNLQDTTLVLVTHDRQAAQGCDQHYQLNHGQCHRA